MSSYKKEQRSQAEELNDILKNFVKKQKLNKNLKLIKLEYIEPKYSTPKTNEDSFYKHLNSRRKTKYGRIPNLV